MKIFKEIFGRIWAVYAALLFVSTMLVFFIPFLLFCYFEKEPRKTYRFVRFARIWMAVFLTGMGAPLRVRGRENFASGENYIVLCNHRTFMDVPVSSPSIPGGNKTIAKAELAKVPLFGLLYRTGSVLVDRNSDGSRKEGFTKMTEVLNLGLHMCIYPEGTRNRSAEPLKPSHNGAFRLARSTGKSIIPSLIFNSNKALPTGKGFFALPYRLEIHFLPPVPVGELSAEQLREKVFEIMRTYYVAHAR